jgi:uncharacterized membrane protein YvbJ
MAMITCDECGEQVSERAPACVHCGNPITASGGTGTKNTEKISTVTWFFFSIGLAFLAFVLSIIVIGIAVGIVIYFFTDENPIDASWRWWHYVLFVCFVFSPSCGVASSAFDKLQE